MRRRIDKEEEKVRLKRRRRLGKEEEKVR